MKSDTRTRLSPELEITQQHVNKAGSGTKKKIWKKIMKKIFRKTIEEKLESYPIEINFLEGKKIPREEFEEQEFQRYFTNYFEAEYNGWKLVGTQEAHSWCGMWKTEGCTNKKEHKKHGFKGRAYVRQYKRSCFRASCKVCFRKWAIRQATVASNRIRVYQKKSKRTAHLIKVCAPPNSTPSKKDAIAILKDAGCEGGSIVFAPFEKNSDYEDWSYNPSFYVMCFGRINRWMQCQARGWSLKLVGEFTPDNSNEKIFEAYNEILLKSGTKKGNHTFVWFGQLSYCKLRIGKIAKNGKLCPICHNKLHQIYHKGVFPAIPPDKSFEGIINCKGWHLVETKQKGNIQKLLSAKVLIMLYSKMRFSFLPIK